ncbi:deoxyribose-phosphate aldolase [Marininema mesophilum]|uniref:Deoxyribose-phosphate aldolase n=1 Tax=Marininema mesophilum TaxID=1048340 RepID=A0A1H2R6Q4_9BACL|nr:deoxyribose-phosphate aldolase [Marininema mesophilum]SDW15005.1 deoxyribose-phosphate aldolase [Marininema mesophilum]
MNVRELASMIDHTLLKPEATSDQVDRLCEEAAEHHFASVCINPFWVARAAKKLKGTGVKVCTVVGFPLGATTSEAKAFETKDAIRNGASEIDMVMNIGALKSGDLDTVRQDIAAVVEAADGVLVKVILETGLLNSDEIRVASEKAKAAGAHFVKTSTGFGHGGATEEAVQLMRETVGEEVGVKASGGVRDFSGAKKMVQAGANRIGASSSVAIVSGKQGSQGY